MTNTNQNANDGASPELQRMFRKLEVQLRGISSPKLDPVERGAKLKAVLEDFAEQAMALFVTRHEQTKRARRYYH